MKRFNTANEGKNNTTNESDTNSSENTEELTEDDIVFPLPEPVTFVTFLQRSSAYPYSED